VSQTPRRTSQGARLHGYPFSPWWLLFDSGLSTGLLVGRFPVDQFRDSAAQRLLGPAGISDQLTIVDAAEIIQLRWGGLIPQVGR
jgi:hypothetical protein